MWLAHMHTTNISGLRKFNDVAACLDIREMT
jgi:hypothetical protein